MSKPAAFCIVVRPLPDASDPAGYRRLRILLKRLLRSYRMHVVSIRPVNGKQVR
jgi:hypothetical protein